MKRTSIGTWAYNVGPYGENPIPFDTVGETLAKLKFDGLELGGFNGYPNPHNHPEKEQRDALKEKLSGWGLSISGFAQDLWSEQLLNTEDQSKYISSCAFLLFTQHLFKCILFGVLGFAFKPYVLLLLLVIIGGVIGTLLGKLIVFKVPEYYFKLFIKILLLIISLNLIVNSINNILM